MVDGLRGISSRRGTVNELGGITGNRSTVNGSGGIGSNRSMVNGPGGIISSTLGGSNIRRSSCRSVNSSKLLLISTVSMDALGSSMGLAADDGGVLSVGLGDSVADSGGVPQLDGLGVGLVSRSCSNKQGHHKSLYKIYNVYFLNYFS